MSERTLEFIALIIVCVLCAVFIIVTVYTIINQKPTCEGWSYVHGCPARPGEPVRIWK